MNQIEAMNKVLRIASAIANAKGLDGGQAHLVMVELGMLTELREAFRAMDAGQIEPSPLQARED